MIASSLDRRLIGFLIAGGINTLFGYCAFGGLLLVGASPHLAVIVGGVTGALFNFLTTSAVFRSRDLRKLPRFLAVYAVMISVNMALLELGLRAGLQPLVAQAIILPTVALTFLAMRRFVFAASREQTA